MVEFRTMFPLRFFFRDDQSPVDIALCAHPKVQKLNWRDLYKSGPVDTKNIKKT